MVTLLFSCLNKIKLFAASHCGEMTERTWDGNAEIH